MSINDRSLGSDRSAPVLFTSAGAPALSLDSALAILTALYIGGAAALAPSAFLTVAQAYVRTLLVPLPFLIIAGIFGAGLIWGRSDPLRFGFRLLALRWRTATKALTACFLGTIAFTTYKVMIPSIVPFYADNILADIGEMVFGVAPWRLAHYFDSNALAAVVCFSYAKLWFIEWFGLVVFVAFWGDRAARRRYFWALFPTTAICGTLLATCLSSVGPILYEATYGGARFEGLLETLRKYPANRDVLIYAEYLLNAHRNNQPAIGTGISAMPSMHAAYATLNALLLLGIRRSLGIVGISFAAFIQFGSVYTGWHYAVDGYVSILVVCGIWAFTGWLCAERREEARAPDPAGDA